jgi:hypothetical protein
MPALVLALAFALGSAGATATAAQARPKPPLSSELRATSPRGSDDVSALGHLGEPTPLPNGATRIFPTTASCRSTAHPR